MPRPRRTRAAARPRSRSDRHALARSIASRSWREPRAAARASPRTLRSDTAAPRRDPADCAGWDRAPPGRTRAAAGRRKPAMARTGLPRIRHAPSGAPRQGRIGIGYATLETARAEGGAAGGGAAPRGSLDLAEVDALLERLARTTGKGSSQAKERLLQELFARATPVEQEFLFRLLTGELRQGALEGLMTEAVARGADLEPEAVRRAAMLVGDLGAVARAARSEGAAGLARFQVQLFR